MATNQAKSSVTKAVYEKAGAVLWADTEITWSSVSALWGLDQRLGNNQAKSSVTKSTVSKS